MVTPSAISEIMIDDRIQSFMEVNLPFCSSLRSGSREQELLKMIIPDTAAKESWNEGEKRADGSATRIISAARQRVLKIEFCLSEITAMIRIVVMINALTAGGFAPDIAV